jgi:hypothetical protein
MQPYCISCTQGGMPSLDGLHLPPRTTVEKLRCATPTCHSGSVPLSITRPESDSLLAHGGGVTRLTQITNPNTSQFHLLVPGQKGPITETQQCRTAAACCVATEVNSYKGRAANDVLCIGSDKYTKWSTPARAFKSVSGRSDDSAQPSSATAPGQLSMYCCVQCPSNIANIRTTSSHISRGQHCTAWH